jgi:hypothetical protein
MKALLFAAALLASAASIAQTPLPPRIGPIGEPAGTGAYPAIAEGRADAPGYTIYSPHRPPSASMPLVLWGNGACVDNGLSAGNFLREIASHGYFVIANGAARQERLAAQPAPSAPAAPPPPPRRTADETSVAQLLAAIDWAERASADPAHPYYGRIDTGRIAVMGHSCGGLQALAAGADPRIDTVVAFASGVYQRPGGGRSGVAIVKEDLRSLHTPVAYVLGGPEDIAYPNGADDYDRIGHVPVMLASLPVGHGGTFDIANGGDWARVGTAWLDWQLKADHNAARWFVGPDCRLCTTFGWTVQRKKFPETP